MFFLDTIQYSNIDDVLKTERSYEANAGSPLVSLQTYAPAAATSGGGSSAPSNEYNTFSTEATERGVSAPLGREYNFAPNL